MQPTTSDVFFDPIVKYYRNAKPLTYFQYFFPKYNGISVD